jgi:uncharacterized protein (UPF0248 family)
VLLDVQPIQELIHRIKWDPEFGRGSFALGYYDRVAREERRVAFASIDLDPGGTSFAAVDEDGAVVHIPLHRVRTVYKNGEAIWRRPTT